MSLKITNYFWGVVLLVLLVLSVKWAYISTDAPYYLSVARDISRGNVPYKDIYLSYTPVMMYLNSIIPLIFKDPSYFIFLSFQFLMIAITSCLLYDISYRNNGNRLKSLFLSLLFFISVLASDGTYINLEVYVILFVILAFWLYQKGYFFLCGVALALSFFSKQYGILNFIPFFLLIVFRRDYRKNYLIRFVIGGLVPLGVFIFYFFFLQQADRKNVLLQLTGAGYDQDMIELETNLFSFLAGAKIFLLLLIPLSLVFIKQNPLRDKVNIILLVGLAVNLLPLYIQTVSHYFLLTFPFIFILLGRNLNYSHKNILLGSNLVLLIIFSLIASRICRYKNVYDEQLKLAAETRKEYPMGSKVFLYKHYRFLYILNNYQNPVLKQVGYRYGFEPDEEFSEKYEVLRRKVKKD